MIESAFHQALASGGAAFVAAEREVAAAGAAALPFLRERAEAARGVPALVARLLLARAAGDDPPAAALAYLDAEEARTAPTAAGEPIPPVVAEALAERFPDAAPYLAAYLVKLGDAWPHWKTVAVSTFLGRVDGPGTDDALLAFALETPSALYRRVATAALVTAGDAGTVAKVEAVLDGAGEAREELAETAADLRRRLGLDPSTPA